MATIVKCAKVLRPSASVGFSSAKLSFSSVSSIPALWTKQGFKGLDLTFQFRQCCTFGREYESILAERNEVMNEVARSRKEIERLRAVIKSTMKNMGIVVKSLKQIDEELSGEPKPEYDSFYAEDGSEGRPNKKRKYNDDLCRRDDFL